MSYEDWLIIFDKCEIFNLHPLNDKASFLNDRVLNVQKV